MWIFLIPFVAKAAVQSSNQVPVSPAVSTAVSKIVARETQPKAAAKSFAAETLVGHETHPAPTWQEQLTHRAMKTPKAARSTLIFDLPLTYNHRVSQWIQQFQVRGTNWFGRWLEKSYRYMPLIQKELKTHGLPQDLAYMVMIESGFEASAKSHAGAIGPWQFIQPTGERYGLKVTWWLDERMDLKKSTLAAIRYMRDLYDEFGSWYLVAASYNMGENGLRRQINKYKTRDFWHLAKLGALPQETTDYVPKILAAMMIAKSPALYGFHNIAKLNAVEFDLVAVPGGTDLGALADHLRLTRKALKDLNAELIVGYVPTSVHQHNIRVPKGAAPLVAQFFGSEAQRISLNGSLRSESRPN